MVRLIDRPDMNLDVYRGRKTTMQQQQHDHLLLTSPFPNFMTSNFRVLTSNIFFYFRLRLGQGGWVGAEADFLCAR